MLKRDNIGAKYSQFALPPAPQTGFSPACKRKFLLHVGLHKTGTTSLQGWLARYKGWLAQEFGIMVGQPAADAHCVPLTYRSLEDPNLFPGRWHYCNLTSFDFIMNRTLESLSNPLAPVIMSSEVFSALHDKGLDFSPNRYRFGIFGAGGKHVYSGAIWVSEHSLQTHRLW